MHAAIAEAEGIAPVTLKEAMSRPDWPRWKEAMTKEIDQLIENKTWDVVDLPPPEKGKVNVVGCRWVYAYKKDAAVSRPRPCFRKAGRRDVVQGL